MAPPFYKIIINSVDVMQRSANVVTDWRDGYYTIDVPDFLHNDTRWQVAVDSFVTSTTVTSGLIMHCDSFTQPNCYSTTSQTNTDAILISNGSMRNSLQNNSLGIQISDFSFMRGKMMRFFFTTLDNVAIPAATTFGTNFQWSLCLMVYPIPNVRDS